MKYLEPSELLTAVAGVLREVVVPTCTDAYAAGQLWASIGILENLAARVEERREIGLSEARLLATWLTEQGIDVEPDLSVATARALTSSAAQPGSGSLHSVLERIQQAERPLRRPTYFHQAFGGG